jgi:hypothetical protein
MQLAFGSAVTSPQIGRRGITEIARDDVSFGARLGWRVKLLACARGDGRLSASVTPAFVPERHPFAEPVGAHNCIRVIGRASGSLTFAGSGAGRDPTASAVIGDIVAALRSLTGTRHDSPYLAPLPPHAIAPLSLRHVIRLSSLRDARPALQVLGANGMDAQPAGDAPAVIAGPLPLDRANELGAALDAGGIRSAAILPLWDD